MNSTGQINIRMIPKEKTSIFKSLKLFTSPRLLFRLVSMSIVGGALYSIFYGLSTDISSIGLSNVSIAGILLGVTQTIGYFIVLPFVHKMKRRFWTLMFYCAMLLGVIALLVISLAVQVGSLP